MVGIEVMEAIEVVVEVMELPGIEIGEERGDGDEIKAGYGGR